MEWTDCLSPGADLATFLLDQHLTGGLPHRHLDDDASSLSSAETTAEDPSVILALVRLLGQQARQLVNGKQHREQAAAQIVELRATLAAIKCSASEICDGREGLEAVVGAMTAAAADLDDTVCSALACGARPLPSTGRRAIVPSPPRRRRETPMPSSPGAIAPKDGAACELRMLVFRLSHGLARVERAYGAGADGESSPCRTMGSEGSPFRR